jgi:splicing factor 3A subunit 3
MVLEEQRNLHEDLERLEQAISDRLLEEPKQVCLQALHNDRQLADILTS